MKGHPVDADIQPRRSAVVSTVLAAAGIWLAWMMYGGGKTEPGAALTARLQPLHTLLANRYYVDHLYNWIAGRLVLGIAELAARFDTVVVDGAVNGIGAMVVGLGSGLRRAQTGQVQTYGWVLFAGAITLGGSCPAVLLGLRVSVLASLASVARPEATPDGAIATQS